jgi:hypothetical protein
VGAVALSGYVAAGKLSAWRDADAAYREAGAWLDAHNAPNDTVIMVGNPPGFWYHTHRPAVVVPNGDVETLLAAADRYGARYVLLDRNRPAHLAGLYTAPIATRGGVGGEKGAGGLVRSGTVSTVMSPCVRGNLSVSGGGRSH